MALRWRHNGCHSVSNHQPHNCLLNRLFRRKSKKTSKLRVTGLCARNSPGTGEFPAQMASYAENVSIWWRHHVGRLLFWGNSTQIIKYQRFLWDVIAYLCPYFDGGFPEAVTWMSNYFLWCNILCNYLSMPSIKCWLSLPLPVTDAPVPTVYIYR